MSNQDHANQESGGKPRRRGAEEDPEREESPSGTPKGRGASDLPSSTGGSGTIKVNG
jgi:hypothetical protein